MSGLLLGLDAGSRGIRCSVVDVESGQITSATRSWSAVPAAEAGVFAFNMDLACCWRLLGEVSRETLIKAKARPSEVLGVAVSGMRFSLVLVDEEGSVIFAAPNRDSRAAEEAIALANGDVLSLRTRTGHWPLPIFAAPRLQWLASNDPPTLRKAAHVLSLSDWIGYHLTGVPSTTPSQASGTLLFDVAEKQWLWELVKELGITERLFPPVVEAGTPLGGLLPGAAAHLGLLGGTPVVVGGADTQCAMLGVGAVEPEQLGVVAGSTTPVQLVTAAPWKGDEADLWVGNHVVPDRWVIESNAGPVGDSLNWFASLLFPGRSDGVQRFVANAAACTPGAGGIIYAGSANVMNAGEMAMPIGNLSFPPLAFADDVPPLPHLSRAVLEGMAHAVKRKVDQLVSTPVGRRAEVRMAGGMTQSPVWTRLVANILDRPVRVSACPDASSIGAAICAGVGAGAFPGLRDGVARLARVHEVMPDPEHTLCYRDLSLDWDRLIRARSSADQLAAGIALQHMILQAPGDGTASRWRPPSHPLRILVTADLDDDSLGAMRELGYVEYASYRDAMRLLTGDELAQAATGFHVFITEVDLVDKSVLLRLPDLRVVASCRGSAVNVDVAACSALAIPVLSVPGRNADAVADLTLAFMLALARKVVAANAFLHEPGRDAGDMGKQGQAHVELQGHELRSKTVGLVGFGAVGKAVTQRLQPFGPRVLVHDPYVDENDIRAAGGTPVPLKSLLSTSDYVSLHVPTTSETQELIGAGELSLMKQGAWLINTARGALVDEDALHAALSSGRLAGAALDVFRNEPPGSEEPLLALPNVLATPHIAGNTFDVAAHQGQAVVEDLSRMVRGEPPLGILNPDALQSFSWNEPRSVADVAALAASDSEFRPAVDDLRHEVTTAEHRASPAQIGQTASRPAGVAWDPGHTTTNPAKEQMERVLQSFVSSLGDDEALTRFAANNTVSSHYFVNDFGLEFHFRFREGRVTAGMGMPPEPVDVRMKARAENLDSILTGRLNGNKAALTGRLSFTGDLRLAMSMQKIQGDLVRLYSAAREGCGGIDFSKMGGKVGSGEPARPANASLAESRGPSAGLQTLSTVGRPASANGSLPSIPVSGGQAEIEDLRERILRITEELLAADLITATGGNVSVRIPGAAEALVTPSQLDKGALSKDMMVRIDLEGNALDPDALAPSSESQLHSEIYKARLDVEAVIHTHATFATILGVADLPFLPVSTEAAFLGEIPRVPFIMPGSAELAKRVREALGDGMAVVLQNHGLVTTGSTLEHAANTAKLIERTSQIIWCCYALGKKPRTLPKNVLGVLREIGRMIG